MNAKNLRFGAWAGIASLAVMVPMTPLLLFVNVESDFTLRVASAAIQLIGAWLTVVLLYILQKYFRALPVLGAARYLSILILIEIVATLGITISLLVPSIESTVYIPLAVLLVVNGFVFILFGAAVILSKPVLFGLSWPLGITSIVIGALLSIIVGAIPAMPLIIVWAVLAVTILFGAASEADLVSQRQLTAHSRLSG